MKIQFICPVLILIEINQGLTTPSGIMHYKKFSISFLVLEKQNVNNMQLNKNTNTNVHNVKLPVTEQLLVTLLTVYHLIGQISKSV
jgi:hypothetical protein